MKIVIDIPEEVYMDIKEEVRTKVNTFEHIPFLHEVISVGTPLPKGHGDLVDFDKLCEEYWDGNYMEIHKDDLPNIKPIVEADKEGSDAYSD